MEAKRRGKENVFSFTKESSSFFLRLTYPLPKVNLP
jgi:hypothetical protein